MTIEKLKEKLVKAEDMLKKIETVYQQQLGQVNLLKEMIKEEETVK